MRRRTPARPIWSWSSRSGAKHEIPQSSPGDGMIEAEQAMHDPGMRLREVKVVSEHRAIARWKAFEFGWRRVA